MIRTFKLNECDAVSIVQLMDRVIEATARALLSGLIQESNTSHYQDVLRHTSSLRERYVLALNIVIPLDNEVSVLVREALMETQPQQPVTSKADAFVEEFYYNPKNKKDIH